MFRIRTCRLLAAISGIVLIWALQAYSRPALSLVEEFKARRQLYMARYHDGVTVVFNAPETDGEFVVKKDFYYLTGFSEPGAILVLSPNDAENKETLFVLERNLEKERWTGAMLEAGNEAEKKLGIARVMTTNFFQSELSRLCAADKIIYTVFPWHSTADVPSFEENQAERLRKLFPFSEIRNAAPQIAALRMRKSTAEIGLLRKAIDISLAGQRVAVSVVADGRYEYEVEAALEYEIHRLGAARLGYPSIVGSGPNSCILHYDKNDRLMKNGELVVIDIGGEFEEYTADITRTFPVAGKFNPRQREIYDIVLGAQEAALKEVRPGVSIGKDGPIHKAAFEYINTHGKDREGNPLGRYFIHGTSHHIGLDVHDVVSGPNRLLEPGMVITVEPGIYIPEESLGVRIEDDVLVTEDGYELLSRDLPRKAEEIEKLMKAMKDRQCLEWQRQK